MTKAKLRALKVRPPIPHRIFDALYQALDSALPAVEYMDEREGMAFTIAEVRSTLKKARPYYVPPATPPLPASLYYRPKKNKRRS